MPVEILPISGERPTQKECTLTVEDRGKFSSKSKLCAESFTAGTTHNTKNPQGIQITELKQWFFFFLLCILVKICAYKCQAIPKGTGWRSFKTHRPPGLSFIIMLPTFCELLPCLVSTEIRVKPKDTYLLIHQC